MATKRKLACLTAEQKKEICVFHGNNSNKKQQEIADILSARLDQTVSRRTVGDILAEKQKWLDCCHSSSSKKIRAGKHVEMEAALQLWFASARSLTSSLLMLFCARRLNNLERSLALEIFVTRMVGCFVLKCAVV